MSWLPRDPSQFGYVIEAGQVQTDGSVLVRWGIDTADRPTFDTAGTADTTAMLLVRSGRFIVEELDL